MTDLAIPMKTPEPPASGLFSRRALVTLSWVLPAAVLALSGVAKLVDPSGAPPRIAAALTTHVPYAVLLRALGFVEVLAAILIAVPRTRAPGRMAAFVLIFAFSAFVALQADDARFVKDCGCFGPLSLNTKTAVATRVTWMLVRNAAVGAVLAFGAYADRPRSERLSVAFNAAAFIGIVVLLGTVYVAERIMRAQALNDVRACEISCAQSQSLGWTLPNAGLRRADGEATSVRRELRAGDHLLFFTTDCPFCKRAAPGWVELGRRIEAKGGRLLLVAAEDDGSVAKWKSDHGCAALTHFVLQDRADLRLLGVAGVPQLLAVGANLAVTFSETQRRRPTFMESLEVGSLGVAGLDRLVWDRIAVALFGEGATCDAATKSPAGTVAAQVRRDGAALGRIVILHSEEQGTRDIEIAVGLEAGDTIRAIVPLARGAYASLLDPESRSIEALRGLSLVAAIEKSTELAKEKSPESEMSGTVARLLAKIAPPRPKK